jgi:hypothetical protein
MNAPKLKAVYFSGFLLSATISGCSFGQEESAAAASVGSDTTVADSKSASLSIEVFKSPRCGCCEQWIEHLEKHGFDVNTTTVKNMSLVKAEHQIPREMMSCHTGVIDGLVVEGHVPANDIKNYLAQRTASSDDAVIGLSIPGMPHGSPGMETGRKDDYAVLAFTAAGEAEVVKHYDNN